MALSFGGSDNTLTSFEKARAVILPVPYARTVTYRKGTEKGPEAILRASDNLELFDEELGRDIYTIGINTQSPLKVSDLEPEKMILLVEARAFDLFKQDKTPVIIGGEHSVSIGAVKAAKRLYNKLSILYFDAHCDMRHSYGGANYSHACAARRLMEIAPLVEAGVRSMSKGEFDFILANDIKIIKMSETMDIETWPDDIKGRLSKEVYISVDLDVFDPSIMPSVGNPEPGGMSWHDFLKAIRYITTDKKIVGFDIVELSPIKDMAAPDFMAAKLLYKILGYISCRNHK